MVNGYLSPQYIAQYMAKLKWFEENPVAVSVSEELYMRKLERKALRKRGAVR